MEIKDIKKPKFFMEDHVIAKGYDGDFIMGMINDAKFIEGEWLYTIMPFGYRVEEKDIIFYEKIK